MNTIRSPRSNTSSSPPFMPVTTRCAGGSRPSAGSPTCCTIRSPTTTAPRSTPSPTPCGSRDHVRHLSSSAGRYPSAGQTISVVPSTPVIGPRPRRKGIVVPTDRAPPFAGELDVADHVRSTDAVERHDLVAHESAVDAAPTVAAGGARTSDPRPHHEDAGDGDDDGGDELQGDRVGRTESDDGGGEAPHRGEGGVEGDVVRLDGQEEHSRCDPGDGRPRTFSLPLTLWPCRRRHASRCSSSTTTHHSG